VKVSPDKVGFQPINFHDRDPRLARRIQHARDTPVMMQLL
jgi:hypothetical protein